MAKVITDKDRINEVLTRGVEIIYPKKEDLEKLLLSGKRIRLYCGFDPSAPSLHIGNAIAFNKLSQFQELGHEVIFLIGDFTGMIGDPTDKQSARQKLTREIVQANAQSYKEQASAYLRFDGENPAQVLYNSDWNDKLSFADLIELASNFTVQQMIQRDMFQQRLKDEKPIYLHEFLYPLTQAYDSVAMEVDLEVGGNDQMFNMMCGRDLLKALKNKEKSVLTLQLLADEAGKKMGKSEGNAVFLDQTPENIYGAVMSWADGVIVPGFELATKISLDEVEDIRKQLKDGQVNPRDLKMRLAFEICALVHGREKAEAAQANFIKTVQKKEMPEEIKNYELKIKNCGIVDLLVEVKMAASKSEARRLIEQGGIKVDNETVKDEKTIITIKPEGTLLRRGKRQFLRVIKN